MEESNNNRVTPEVLKPIPNYWCWGSKKVNMTYNGKGNDY